MPYFKAISEFKLGLQSEKPQSRSKLMIYFFVTCDDEIWGMTLRINRAAFLCYFKLCASFRSHRSIQTGVTVRKRPIWGKIVDFSHVTLKFVGWPGKVIGHIFCATSSCVHHIIAIGQFKLELQPGNPNSGENRQFFVQCDLEVWWMALQNIRVSLLYYFMLCVS